MMISFPTQSISRGAYYKRAVRNSTRNNERRTYLGTQKDPRQHHDPQSCGHIVEQQCIENERQHAHPSSGYNPCEVVRAMERAGSRRTAVQLQAQSTSGRMHTCHHCLLLSVSHDNKHEVCQKGRTNADIGHEDEPTQKRDEDQRRPIVHCGEGLEEVRSLLKTLTKQPWIGNATSSVKRQAPFASKALVLTWM